MMNPKTTPIRRFEAPASKCVYPGNVEARSGKGPIKKSDYRRELKSGQCRPEIYTRDELKKFFEANDTGRRGFVR